jgi:hypothetical protein
MLIVEHYSECVVVTNHPDGELHKIAILRQVHFEVKFAAKRYIWQQLIIRHHLLTTSTIVLQMYMMFEI